MRAIVRSNLPETTAALTLLALGGIFGAVMGIVPSSLVPEYPVLVDVVPHLNVAISLVAIATISAGVRSIRNDRISRHRALMSTSTLLFGAFLLAYLYKIVVDGTSRYTGPQVIEQFVYLPVLALHMALAVLTVPLVIYVLLLASTHDVMELSATPHPRVGRVAAVLWVTSFGLGIVVYALLYGTG